MSSWPAHGTEAGWAAGVLTIALPQVRSLGKLTPTGDPIRPRTLARLACDSNLTRIVLDGAGQVLDVGRSHAPSPGACGSP